MTQFDYVIVGAGPAGCVLANRLSADPGVTVLLAEAGDEDTKPLIAMPRGFGELLGDPTTVWHDPTPLAGVVVISCCGCCSPRRSPAAWWCWPATCG